MTAESWHNLKVGDQIQLLKIPPVNFTQAEDTLQLYTMLVSNHIIVSVDRIDCWGRPVVSYCYNDLEGNEHAHALAIDEIDEWRKVT
ncbi:MAG TPA: hypothetical protein V6D07_11105 [Trichocoleus sp.]